ncbi:MAG: hypothetical protein NVS4B8_07380 [Herpetosiphon sp.]
MKRVLLVVILWMLGVAPVGAGQKVSGVVDVPILTYHYISVNPDPIRDTLRTGLSVEPHVFAAQLEWLDQHGWTTVTLDDVYFAVHFGWHLPPKPVVLTFDDGYRDFYLEAWPLLQRHHMRATIYLISDPLGQPAYLTPAMVRELSDSPLITIGAHTRTHHPLATLEPARSKDEILGSKVALETLIGRRVRHFCYPYGSYTNLTVSQVEAAGFLTATTTHNGRHHDMQRFIWTRIAIKGGKGLPEFISALSDAGF